jgi:hypothetical protein
MNSDRRQCRGLQSLALALIASTIGCADFSRGPTSSGAGGGEGTVDAAGTADGATLSFATDVLPLLSICKNCHVSDGQASQTALIFSGNTSTDYATVVQFVDTSTPAGSRLLAKIKGNGHGGGTIYAAGSPEYETILTWIEQGASP